jgi:hypothetical protein
VLVVAPVVIGLQFGVRVTVALYAFEVILLLVMSITILARGGHNGLSGTPFSWPHGSTDVLLTFSLAVLAFGGFEAAAPLAEETQNPRRNVPIAVIGAVLISGVIYVIGSYALVIAFGVGRTSALAADPNPFHTAAQAFIPFVAPLVTWIFLTSVTSFLRGRQHPDLAGDLRRRPRRAVEPVAGRGQPAVPHAGPRRGRVRGAQHRHRRDLHRVHRPGHRLGVPFHVRDPRPGHHVPGRQRRAHRGLGQAAPPRRAQEPLAVGGRAGDRGRRAGHPGVG